MFGLFYFHFLFHYMFIIFTNVYEIWRLGHVSSLTSLNTKPSQAPSHIS